MFFISKFLDYTATSGGDSLPYIGTLKPRESQRNINGPVEIQFKDTGLSGRIYGFADAIKTAGEDVRVDSVSHTVAKDPYMERSRVLFSFDGKASLQINFNLEDPLEVGSLLFFKEADILTTSSSLFLTYPFRVSSRPRVLPIRHVDGSTSERVLDEEPRLTLSMSIVPARDFYDERNYEEDSSNNLRKLFEIISPRRPFLYVDTNLDWSGYLLKSSPQRSFEHLISGYNQQRVQTLALEVA